MMMMRDYEQFVFTQLKLLLLLLLHQSITQ